MKAEEIYHIVDKYNLRNGGIISILEDIQEEHNYLPEEALRLVAEKTGRSLVDIYGVATFYKSFSLKPRGKHQIVVCLGTACHVRNGAAIASEFQRQLGIAAGETTPDKEISFDTVNCLGACALGPIAVADGHYFSNVSKAKAAGIIQAARKGIEKTEISLNKRIFPIEVTCPHCNHSLMDDTYFIDGYSSISVTGSFRNKHGWIQLSSLYGSYTTESQHKIPQGTIIEFFCPFCHSELTSDEPCPECSAPLTALFVRGGGTVYFCSRQGCKGHRLDLT